MPAFQAGVAGSTPADGSIEGSANGRPSGFWLRLWRFDPSALSVRLASTVHAEVAQPVEARSSNLRWCGFESRPRYHAFEAHEVERVPGADEAEGSNPSGGSMRL